MRALLLFSFFLAASFNLFSQWAPMPALTGSTDPWVLCDGQDIITGSGGATSMYYSHDFGNSWHLKPLGTFVAATLWNGNLIRSDSVQNILIDNNISGSDVLLSSYFNIHQLRVLNIQYSAGRFFVLADTALVWTIFYSDDTCHTWQRMQGIPPLASNNHCYKVSNGVVYLATADTLYASLDNGNTWATHPLYLSNNPPISIDARDSIVGIIASGSLIYSTNAGRTTALAPRSYSNGNTAGVVVADSGIYVGCIDFPRGVYLFNPYNYRYDTLNIAALADSSIFSIFYGNGKIIISTTSSGIYWADEPTRTAHNFAKPLYSQSVFGLATGGSRLLTLDKWTYISGGRGSRNELRYSADRGNTFSSPYVSYSSVNAYMLVDTTPYVYLTNAPFNVSSYDLYKLSGTQPVLVSHDTNVTNSYGPQAVFNIGDSDFYRVDLTYSGYWLLYSSNAGNTWRKVGAMRDLFDFFDYYVVQDSAFLLFGDSIYIYDHLGNRCSVIFGGLETNYYYPRRIWVTDSIIIMSDYNFVSTKSRRGGIWHTIATPSQFNNRTIFTTSGWNAGYIFVSVDSQGIYVLPPDSTAWQPFGQGLADLTPGTFYFNDSFVYCRFIGSFWLWRRPLSDLLTTPVLCTDTTIYRNAAICAGQRYIFHADTLTAAGIYHDTLTRAGGCDSIITLTLTVHPQPMVGLNWNNLYANHDLTQWGLSGRGDTVWAKWCNPYTFPMSGGTPAGGTYTGGFVVNDSFNIPSNWFPSPVNVDTITYSYTDSLGCTASAMDTFQFQICEGIVTIPGQASLSIYPNPNTGTFTLTSSGAVGREYTITDVLGEVVDQQQISSGTQVIDLHNAVPGVYVLSVNGTAPVMFTVMR